MMTRVQTILSAGCVLCTLAAAAGALAEVASQHEVRPALVEVTLLVAPVLSRWWVVAAEFCRMRCSKGEQPGNTAIVHAL
jgi:hypothetical protein